MPRSATTTGTMDGSTRDCQVTSSHPPATRRSDLPMTTPSTTTPPASATSAANVREKPRSLAIAESARSPARPSGTTRLRVSMASARVGSGELVGLQGVARAALAVEPHAPDREDDEQAHARDDGHVRNIE